MLFSPLLVFAGLGLLLWRGLALDPNHMPSALEGRPLPAFELRDLDGEVISQAALLGEPALLNVWATWCVACAAEHEQLMQMARRGIVIHSINYKDAVDAAREWLQTKGDPYRSTIVDAEGRLGLDLGVTGAPETYVIDDKGVVRMRHQGPLDERVWRDSIEPLFNSLRGTSNR